MSHAHAAMSCHTHAGRIAMEHRSRGQLVGTTRGRRRLRIARLAWRSTSRWTATGTTKMRQVADSISEMPLWLYLTCAAIAGPSSRTRFLRHPWQFKMLLGLLLRQLSLHFHVDLRRLDFNLRRHHFRLSPGMSLRLWRLWSESCRAASPLWRPSYGIEAHRLLHRVLFLFRRVLLLLRGLPLLLLQSEAASVGALRRLRSVLRWVFSVVSSPDGLHVVTAMIAWSCGC